MGRVRLGRISLLCAICLAGVLHAGTAAAESVTVMPKTNHSALTMSTDGSYGFQVLPGKPLQLDLVGPGKLTLTVRLNHPRKRKTYRGRLHIRRDERIARRLRLKLFRSRVGAYNEDDAIHPSTPKVLRLRVPAGLQRYSFTLKARRPTSMTLGIEYDTKADQSAAQQDAELALVPLVAPGEAEPTGDTPQPDPDEVALVPLAPDAPEGENAPEPAAEPEPADEEQPAAVAAGPGDGLKVDEPPPAAPKEAEPEKDPEVAAAEAPQPEPPAGDTAAPVENIAPEPEAGAGRVEQDAPEAEGGKVFAIGVKAGEITPLQNIGSASFKVGLDLRYVLPVFDGRLSLGLEAGYHSYSAAIGYDNTATKTNLDLQIIPISLQLYYRIPLGTFLEPFVGAGADLVIGFAEVGYQGDGDSRSDGSAIGFGGHVNAGLEAELGPGFLVLEVRAGMSNIDLEVIDNVNASGIAVMAGYRFEI